MGKSSEKIKISSKQMRFGISLKNIVNEGLKRGRGVNQSEGKNPVFKVARGMLNAVFNSSPSQICIR